MIIHIFNEREQKVLQEAMKKKDMSAEAVVRHFFRMGQMMDHYISQGYRPIFRKSQALGLIREEIEVDPLDHGPKMAPMPERYNCPTCGEEYAVGTPCDLCTCTCEQTDGKSCPIPLHQPARELTWKDCTCDVGSSADPNCVWCNRPNKDTYVVSKHIDCACWKTGRFVRVEGCQHHPWDL